MPELSRDEREFLASGVLQWAGPASPSQALAVALGAPSVEALAEKGSKLGRKLRGSDALPFDEILFALISTEIIFASDRWGAGVEWHTVTGYSDSEAIEMLRKLQRKLVGLGPWSPGQLSEQA